MEVDCSMIEVTAILRKATHGLEGREPQRITPRPSTTSTFRGQVVPLPDLNPVGIFP
jgi:hypothetical protein